MRKSELLKLIKDYEANLTGKAEKSLLVTELKEFIENYHLAEGEVLFGEFVLNLDGTTKRSLREELKKEDAATQQLFTLFEYADKVDEDFTTSNKNEINRPTDTKSALDVKKPVRTPDDIYEIPDSPIDMLDDFNEQKVIEFLPPPPPPGLLNQLFEAKEARHVLPNVLKYLEPDDLLALGQTSSFFSRTLTNNPKHWYDALLALGIDKKLLNNVIDANIIKNYRNLYFSVKNYIRSGREIRALTRNNVTTITAGHAPDSEKVLLCLSGEIEVLQALGISDGVNNMNILKDIYHHVCLSVNLSAAQYIYEGILSGQYRPAEDTKESYIRFRTRDFFDRKLLNLIVSSGHLRALEMLKRNYAKEISGLFSMELEARIYFICAFTSGNIKMIHEVISIAIDKKHNIQNLLITPYRHGYNCLNVAVEEGNQQALRLAMGYIQNVNNHLMANSGQNLKLLLLTAIVKSQQAMLEYLLPRYFAGFSNVGDLQRAYIDVLKLLPNNDNADFIRKATKTLASLYISRAQMNPGWPKALEGTAVNMFKRRLETGKMTQEDYDKKMSLPIDLIRDYEQLSLSLIVTMLITASAKNPYSLECALKLGADVKELTQEQIESTIMVCIEKNNLQTLKLLVLSLPRDGEQFKSVSMKLPQFISKAVDTIVNADLNNYAVMEFLYQWMKDASQDIIMMIRIDLNNEQLLPNIVKKNNIAFLKFLLTKTETMHDPSLARMPLEAIKGYNLDILKFLLDNPNLFLVKFDVSAVNKYLAEDKNFEDLIQNGDVKLIKYMVEHGLLNPDHVTSSNENIYLLAAKYRNFEVLKFALEELKCDKNAINKSGKSALHLLAKGYGTETRTVTNEERVLQMFTYLREHDVKVNGNYAKTKSYVLEDLMISSYSPAFRTKIRTILNKPFCDFNRAASNNVQSTSHKKSKTR